MKVRLVFDDWRQMCNHPDHPGEHSIYQTELGIELSLGDLHSGTTFKGEIELDAETEATIRAA